MNSIFTEVLIYDENMATKVYCLVLSGGDYEDLEMTLSLEKALEWLKKRQKYGQILEYDVSENGISKIWNAIWEYKNGEVSKESTE